MEYLYLILERKILLYYCGMYRCLIAFIFWKFRDWFYLLASLAKAIPGRAEIVEWKLDTDMMMCKKSSDAHLFSHDIIDFRGKQCTVFSPICTMLFGNCAIFTFILSSSNCQFYRRWTSGICLTWLVNVLAGADGQCNGMSQEEYFINRWKLCDCDLFICLFDWHLQDTNSPWWIICYGWYKQL